MGRSAGLGHQGPLRRCLVDRPGLSPPTAQPIVTAADEELAFAQMLAEPEHMDLVIKVLSVNEQDSPIISDDPMYTQEILK